MKYLATGMMSGTSLDGLDICHCEFIVNQQGGGWSYKILEATTIPYSDSWKGKLREAPFLDGRALIALHIEYGHFLGSMAHNFFLRHNIKNPGILASHGHTIYHRPDLGYTFQLGHGAAIASDAKTTVISDFRSKDVALSGQGAPLVPLGDQLLFSQYTYCLNLGGFANISFAKNKQRIAFDICPLNFVMNRLIREARIPAEQYMREEGKCQENQLLAYDPEGQIARKGHTDQNLLQQLNNLPFYRQEGPRSLGEEWVNTHLWPLFQQSSLPLESKLHTFYEHAAQQIVNNLQPSFGEKLLLTGGGAYNQFFCEFLGNLSNGITIVLPDQQTIDFKEALVFALLGIRCIRKEYNCLATATGASIDNIGGSIHNY